MSWLTRLFRPRHRAALAAEGAGQFRRAAALWAEAGQKDRAADALLHLARRSGTLEERLEAWHDALRFLPESDEERRADVEREMAMAVLLEARDRGATSAEEKRRLLDAAERLERHDRPKDAAQAFAILGQKEDQARCLEAAGEVDALEALLDRTSAEESSTAALSRLLAEHDMALRFGARVEARAALAKAAQLAPQDASIAELVRRLEGRIPRPHRVRLGIDGRRVAFVGKLPAVVGRTDADVTIRGTSVSREHCELDVAQGVLQVRDLDSRNGTLVSGLPIRGRVALSGASELGLGDDVTVRVEGTEEGGIALEVRSGIDRGERFVIGAGPLRFEGLSATVSFVEGWAVLTADPGGELTVNEQASALPVHLLLEDRLVVHGVRVEVLS